VGFAPLYADTARQAGNSSPLSERNSTPNGPSFLVPIGLPPFLFPFTCLSRFQMASSSVVAADPNVSLPAPGAVSLSAGTAAVESVFTVPFKCVLSGDKCCGRVNLRTDADIVSVFELFESVVLLSADFSMICHPGDGRMISLAVGPTAKTLVGMVDCPLYAVEVATSMVPARLVFSLPDDHPFGREVKAAVLSNPCPVFHFGYEGAADDAKSADVVVRGAFRFRATGYGIPTVKPITTYKAGK